MEQLQCLEELGVDLDATLPRFLGNKNFYLKMLAKFLDDPNYDLLEKSLQEQDYETAFRAVHTLKGVSVNMGLNLLYDETVLLTEELRKPPYDEDKISMYAGKNFFSGGSVDSIYDHVMRDGDRPAVPSLRQSDSAVAKGFALWGMMVAME